MRTAARKGSTQTWILGRRAGKSLWQSSDTSLPGRGYWTKKEFGKPVERLPLPPGKDIRLVQRCKFPSSEQSPNSVAAEPQETPTGPGFLRIVALESRNTAMVPEGPRHKLVKAAEKTMKRVKPNDKGPLQPLYDGPFLDIHVSKNALERALAFMNAVILSLEAEGLPKACSSA